MPVYESKVISQMYTTGMKLFLVTVLVIFIAISIFLLNIIITNESNALPLYNGTRTGKVIPYLELCTGKTINIFENEKMPIETRDGIKYLTKEDSLCYYKQLSIQTTPTISPTPTKVPVRNKPAPIPTTNPDPLVNCKFTGNCNGQNLTIKSSVCKSSVCCQIRDKWIAYASSNECTLAQKNDWNYVGPQASLKTCVVSFPCTGASYTYQMTDEVCNQAKESALQVCKGTAPAVIANPTPTVDPGYQDLLNQHKIACDKAAADWIGLRQTWETQNFDNYSSSVEAIQALDQYRQQYQQELYDAGCTNTISL